MIRKKATCVTTYLLSVEKRHLLFFNFPVAKYQKSLPFSVSFWLLFLLYYHFRQLKTKFVCLYLPAGFSLSLYFWFFRVNFCVCFGLFKSTTFSLIHFSCPFSHFLSVVSPQSSKFLLRMV